MNTTEEQLNEMINSRREDAELRRSMLKDRALQVAELEGEIALLIRFRDVVRPKGEKETIGSLRYKIKRLERKISRLSSEETKREFIVDDDEGGNDDV